jgi:ribonuclease Z
MQPVIDVLLLGTSGMHPTADRWLSSVLLRCGSELILFDCGEGTQIAWRRSHWGFKRVSTICVSHWHADHIAGLPGVLFSIANAGRTEAVTLYGPVGIGRIVAGLRVIAPHLPFSLDVVELDHGGTFQLGKDLTGRVVLGEHGLPSLAYRLDLRRARRFNRAKAEALDIPRRLWRTLQQGQDVAWTGGTARADDVLMPPRPGLAFGFVTDSRPLDIHRELMRNVDLLVCEGTYGDPADAAKAQEWGHMTFAEAATMAREAKANRLWLTHFSPGLKDPEEWLPEATAIFPESIVGYSGLTVSLSFPDMESESG